MRHSRLIGLIALLLPLSVHGQTGDVWQKEASGRISFTQVGFYRWHEGGISSLALSAGISAAFERAGQTIEQSHALRFTYGVVKQNELGLRKAEDLIHLRSSFSIGRESFLGAFNPVLTIDIRSQFAQGYKYDSKGDEPPVVISDFLSPAAMIESLGLNREPAPWITIQGGLASKQTLVLRSQLRNRYKVRQTRSMRTEVGVSAMIEIDAEPFSNVHLAHSLTLFSAFMAAGKPDFVSEILVTLRINRWLQVNAEYTAQLDRDVSNAIQMKEIVSLGLTFNLLPQRSDAG